MIYGTYRFTLCRLEIDCYCVPGKLLTLCDCKRMTLTSEVIPRTPAKDLMLIVINLMPKRRPMELTKSTNIGFTIVYRLSVQN